MGQIFATDNLANLIIKYITSKVDIKDSTIIEIGPGDGKLTEKLLECHPKKLIAIEKDFEYSQFVKNRFITNNNFESINEDVLEFAPEQEKIKVDYVIGNLPYNLSSSILEHVRDWEFDSAFFMLQKEFAQRMVATPGNNFSRLSAMTQYFFDVKLLKVVSHKMFIPRPKVDSALVYLKKVNAKSLTEQEEICIRKLYVHRKQKLKNAIQHSFKELDNESLKESDKILQHLNEKYTDELNSKLFLLSGSKVINICKEICSIIDLQD